MTSLNPSFSKKYLPNDPNPPKATDHLPDYSFSLTLEAGLSNVESELEYNHIESETPMYAAWFLELSGYFTVIIILVPVKEDLSVSHILRQWSRMSMISAGFLWIGAVGIVANNPVVTAHARPSITIQKVGTPYQHAAAGKVLNNTVPSQATTAKKAVKPPKALTQVKGTIQVVRSNLTWLDQKISAQTAVINVNRRHLATLDAAIYHDQAQLKATKTRYQAMSLELARTRVTLHRKLQVFANEMQFVQQHGEVSYLSVFVGVHSFADFVSRLFLLVEVGQILGRQVQAVRHIQQQEASLESTLLTSIHHISRVTRALDAQAKTLKLANSADSARELALVSLRTKAISELHQSVNEAVHWKRLSAQKPKFLDALSSRLGTINQTLEDLLAMGMGGPMSRQQLFQTLYPMVRPIAKAFALPIPLVMAIITEESGGHQTAVSRTGAIGLMQLEPGTAHWLGIDPYNPQTNIVGGCLYLHQLLQLFDGKLSLALSAYNAGPKYVIQTNAVLPATALYVSDVESLYEAYRTMVYVPPIPVPIATKEPAKKLPTPPPFLRLAYGMIRVTAW